MWKANSTFDFSLPLTFSLPSISCQQGTHTMSSNRVPWSKQVRCMSCALDLNISCLDGGLHFLYYLSNQDRTSTPPESNRTSMLRQRHRHSPQEPTLLSAWNAKCEVYLYRQLAKPFRSFAKCRAQLATLWMATWIQKHLKWRPGFCHCDRSVGGLLASEQAKLIARYTLSSLILTRGWASSRLMIFCS